MDTFDLRLWPGFAEAGGNTSSSAVIDQVSIDSRRIDSQNALFVALLGESHDGHQFVKHAAQTGAKYALVRKDWGSLDIPSSVNLLKVDDPLHAFQAIAQTYRQNFNAFVVAITGSYGKTMVKDLLQAMVSTTKKVGASPESFNSQIGAALSLFTIKREHEIAFIEAGISKKYEMDRLAHMIAPDATVVTHIGKKHMATLGNRDTIASEIIKLAIKTTKENWVILPKDPLLEPFLPQINAESHFWNTFSPILPHGTTVAAEHGARMPYQVSFPDGSEYSSQATFGFYYFMDLINITVKAAWLLGVSSDAIKKTLSHYTAEPMRTEIWTSPIGTTFINDIYCSDPQSVDRALKFLTQGPVDGRKIFVFSGMRGTQNHVEADYRRIGQAIHKAKIDRIVLIGSHPYESLISEVKKHAAQTAISVYSRHNEAFDEMRAWIRQNDTVLLKGDKKAPLDNLTEVFNDSICTNQCLINLAAIQSNIATIRNKLPPKTRIMVMVKALAYGTNDIRMAKFLVTCGVDILGVSYVDEGVALKRAGVTQSIFAINAAVYEAAKVAKWDLEVGVSEKDLITAIAQEASNHEKKIKVHLHINTGMSRFGCRPEEALGLAEYIIKFPSLQLEGIMTHFAAADSPTEDSFTISQVNCLDKVIEELKNKNIHIPWKHAANSSGTIRFNLNQYNMVRLGLAVYGLYPSEATKNALELRLSLSLISRIVGINTCQAGETISYGRSYTVTREKQRIAVLPIGYFDGLHRNYSGKGNVIIRGQKAPMVGKICMDFMMVDITDIPNANIGDSVLIFGEDEYGHYLSPEELAASGDSIIHELITCLGPRIQRIFVLEEAHHLR